MNRLFQNFLAQLKAGTRSLIVLFTLVYLAQIIGDKAKAYSLTGWFAMEPHAVWSGQVWRLITYASLTQSLAGFVMNILFISMLGAWLERVWSPLELWLYCLICTVGTAATTLLLTPFGSGTLIGNVGMTFALLVACAKLFSYEEVLLMGFWKTTVRTAALVLGLINFLLLLSGTSFLSACVLLSGGLIGWLYLSLRWKFIDSQSSQSVSSARIRRLEL